MSATPAWSRVKALFLAALDLPESERAHWVAEQCAGDPDTRDEVCSLLASQSGSRGDLLQLKSQGADVIEVGLVSEINPLGKDEFIVLQYEFKDGLNKYLLSANAAAPGSGLPKSLADVIAFDKQHAAQAMPYFQQETLESSQALGGLDSRAYKAAVARSTSARGIIDTAAMAGYPHVTVPMGTVLGLPVGFSFIAGAFMEPQLLGMAYCFEQATMKRTAPSFVASLLS